MFGYVTVYKPELKIKDYSLYKGVYCTLCKRMGREYTQLSRLLLSYDGAFFVLFKQGLSGETADLKKSRCSFNPCKKCLKVGCAGSLYSLAGAVTVILAYFKLKDNINDNKGIKKLVLYCLMPLFSLLRKKAAKKFPDIYNYVGEQMNSQLLIEQKENVSLDEAADASGKILSYLFSYGESGEKAQLAAGFGYQLGRAVYFLDAYDDYEKDLKRRSFNPFPDRETLSECAPQAVRLCAGALCGYLKDYPEGQFKDIADNIIYDGLYYQIERITEKYRGEHVEQSL